MEMEKVFLLALASAIAGCAGPGELKSISVTMPGGERATIIAHNQQVPDWMLSREKLAFNYVVKGDVSERKLAAVGEAERACRVYTESVRPHNLVAVLSQGVLYAAAGYVGVGIGAHAFTGANATQYAKYGAAATGFAGAANGMVTMGGQTYTFENCGREVLALFPNYEVRVLNKSPY
jgi:hypothetical protein